METENNDMTEGSEEDKPNSFFDENSKCFEMDHLERVPYDDEVGVHYESDYTVQQQIQLQNINTTSL
jgi:hypothetical protein